MQFWFKRLKKIANLEKMERNGKKWKENGKKGLCRAVHSLSLNFGDTEVSGNKKQSRECSFWVKSVNSSIERIRLQITE